MRVLIAGGNGMLGSDLRLAFADQDLFWCAHADLDITDYDAVHKMIADVQPDLIINAAAFTNVDGCEAEPDEAFRVNAVGPRNLAAVAQEMGAAVVQISTDYVFSGDIEMPRKEHDPLGPVSVYGKSKLAGEQLVQALCSRHYIVRTSWLFGLQGKNFVRTMIERGKQNPVVRVVEDQFGSPTYTRDLAQAIRQLTDRPLYGIYHLSNQGVCSWHQFARDIFSNAGMDVRVEAITSAELNRPAPRPHYSMLDNHMWRLNGFVPLRHYSEALSDYIAEMTADSGGVV